MTGLGFIAIRRLRAPLIVILVIFGVSTAGLALLPGPPGELPLSLFDAFYFVSYTATTIGFGEIPYAFSEAQRLWATVVIYLSVVGWTYLVGSLLALGQDRGFRAALVSGRFARAVRGLREPFYIVCGLGETGLMVARALDRMGRRFVAVDLDESRVLELDLGDFATDPPAIRADAASPETLTLAGILSPHCAGVLALTRDDEANLAVAVAAKLLNPKLRTICRAQRPAVIASMETVGVDEIINPFAEFAERLALAMRAPDSHRLLGWLTGPAGGALKPRLPAPPGGWVVCGYGRFGAEVVEAIREGGFDATIVDPKITDAGGLRVVAGHGADDDTLEAAGIREAEGLVAGTDDDVANLTIALAARKMNPGVFLILRQNLVRNAPLFAACRADMVMVPSEIIADECIASLRTRHLARFLALVRQRDNAFAEAIIAHLAPAVGHGAPDFWTVALDGTEAPGLLDALGRSGATSRIDDLMRDPADRSARIAATPLLLVRPGLALELPDPGTPVAPGDESLVAGRPEARRRIAEGLLNANVADYLLTGRAEADAPVARLLRLGRARG